MADLVQLLAAIDKLWKAHAVATSNGGGAWVRHVEPAIYDLKKIATEFKHKLIDHFEEQSEPSNKQVMYAAGFFNEIDKSLQHFDGPTPDLGKLLDQVAPFNEKDLPAYIVQFGNDGEWDSIYRWDKIKGNWIKFDAST